MTTEMNGRRIGRIWFENNEGFSCIESNGECELVLSATKHGDRDEFWVVQYSGIHEVTRHNCRFISTIEWLGPVAQ